MRRRVLLLSVFAFLVFFQVKAQDRYCDEVFSGVTVTSDVEYAQNITVITGGPTNDTLYVDIYEPSGDSLTDRPLILIAHTGSFLPVPQNGQSTGERVDTAMVDLCTMLAKRGYVVGAFSYRQGWNPLDTTVEGRKGGLLNAAYRGIQDARTLVRFFRDNHANGGNTYGIDTSRIVMGGMGTGGYIGVGCATLDKYAEIELAKFLHPQTAASYVDTSMSGDLWGLNTRTLNVGNHVNESSNIHMAFNIGGAIGDSTWLEPGDVPIVSFHCTKDPFAPYKYGPVIVPTTQQFVVNVSGSHDIIRQAVGHGNQAPIIAANLADAYSMAANAINDGHEGLFPFLTDSIEASPWEFWDSAYWANVPHPTAGNFDLAGRATNPDMSRTKSMAYLDTIVNYLAPRICHTLALAPVGIDQKVKRENVMVYPNPASSTFVVTTRDASNPIHGISVVDMLGKTVMRVENVITDKLTVDRGELDGGVYMVDIQFKEGSLAKKIIIK